MNNRRFYIVDVFAERKYAGNQLAVFRDTEGLSDQEMLEITREIDYSETTFIMSEEMKNNGFDVRIFTPKEEVPFAGHPTLGTAAIIQSEIIGRAVKKVHLNLQVGQIPVSFSYPPKEDTIVWMTQIPPEFSQIFAVDRVSEVLSLDPSDIDFRFPIQEVSTGLPFIIVPVISLEAVQNALIHKESYFKLIATTRAKALLVFCPETVEKDNHLHVRVFTDYYGMPEDPATGSANGCLAGYLVNHSFFGPGSIDIRVEQGYEMGRPSLLYLKAEKKNSSRITVRVGGKVVQVARGEFI
ncbi:MAG: PhzF family phenazine biosynthesis protein [Theionarchaea archaeon]|nr:PhzF family phenazine biosynthesis protein [Theionarchaea archaeon]